jgi:GNAT superfamily N-acetyltransferase
VDEIEIREVDTADEVGLRAWWEVGRIASAHDKADDGWPAWESARLAWTGPDPVRRIPRLSAYAGTDLVGICSIQLDDLDNTHLAFVQPAVLPDERCTGIGSALLTAAEERVRADGRTTILSEVCIPLGADEHHPAPAFARRRGYEVAGMEQVKVADLPATEQTWPALAAHAAERAAGYELVAWRDHAPEEHVEEIVRLYTRFLGEIPLGNVDIRPQVWTVQRFRDNELRALDVGKHHVLVAAVAPDGTLAGYSSLFVTDGRPERAGIDSTLVLPEHRGHRLGLAVKVRLHQETRAHHPAVVHVATGNADVNTWMNAVNEALGYRVVETCLEMQKVLA